VNKRKPINLRVLLLVGTTVLLLLVQLADLFVPDLTTPIARVENLGRDLLLRVRGVEEPPGEIAIVAIDDFSFNWTGYRWPWPRTYLAEIVDQLNQGGAQVVGVDILLFEPDPDPAGDEALASALDRAQAAASVLQIVKSPDQDFNLSSLLLPLSPYQAALDGIGVTAFSRDEDAIVRSVQAFDVYDNQVYYHWAFDLARLYLGVAPPSGLTGFSLKFNGESVPLTGSNRMLVNYAGPAATFPTYPAADVHDGITLEQDPDAFRGKIVLLGATSVTMQDVYPTPFSAQQPTAGVEIVANAVNTIIKGAYLREVPPWMALLITIAAALLAALISRSRRPTFTVVSMSVVMLGYAAAGLVLFLRQRLVLPLVTPEIMVFLGVVLPTLEQAVSQEVEKRRVRQLFSRFISPEMVDQMMSTQDLNTLNKRADISILFSDIRGFTTLSEKLAPEDVVALLNPYLEAMSNVIHRHGGTVDKYEGDAILAFFGEPVPYKDHALRALRTALDMHTELAVLRKQWEKEGRPSQIDIGIGINSGEVFVGMLGSEQRISYTVIGDNANLASRLQDLTKTYDWPLLISESTYQQVKDKFETELVDSVLVKGKTKPVNVYKVFGRRGVPKSKKLQPWKK